MFCGKFKHRAELCTFSEVCCLVWRTRVCPGSTLAYSTAALQLVDICNAVVAILEVSEIIFLGNVPCAQKIYLFQEADVVLHETGFQVVTFLPAL